MHTHTKYTHPPDPTTHTHTLTSSVLTQLTRMKLVSATYLYTNSKRREIPPREVLLLRTFRQRALKQKRWTLG